MSKLRMGLAALVALAVGVSVHAATANVLIDLSAEDFVSVLNDGDPVAAWANTGTLGGDFIPAGSGTGIKFSEDVKGVTAVSFTQWGWENAMTNDVASPLAAGVCGPAPWTFEIWVYTDEISGGNTCMFTWTAREKWQNNIAAGTCAEFRWGTDAGNAVEHYDGAYNLGWGGPVPVVGQWHHIVVTRDNSGMERLFLDGGLRTTAGRSGLNLRDDIGFFTIAAVQNLNNLGWDNAFRGSIARLRVYDGGLTTPEVLTSYQDGCLELGLTPAAGGSKFWQGTPGAWEAWGNPLKWIGGLPAAGDSVYIDNGGKAADFNGTLDVSNFQGTHGGLSVTGGVLKVAEPPSGVTLGYGAGNTFDFDLKGGKFHVAGMNQSHLYVGFDGAATSAVIGGGNGLAWLCADGAIQVGKASTGYGYMKIMENGLVTTSNNSFFVTAEGATGTVVVAGGELRSERGHGLILGHGTGAQATLIINDGIVGQFGDLTLSQNGQNESNLAELYLNGGLLWVANIYGNGPATNNVYLNGGVIRNRWGRGDFIHSLTKLAVQAGGACFDVIAGTTVEVWQDMLEDPSSPGGGLVKTGTGTLILRGANTFTGDITVLEGNVLLCNENSLPLGYGGTVFVAAGAGIGWETAGGASKLLDLIDPASDGALLLFSVNAAENLDFSGYHDLALGSGYGGVDYSGAYTPDNKHYRYFLANNTVLYLRNPISDTGASLTLEAGSSGFLDVHGDNAYEGGTTINGGTLVVYHPNALGFSSGGRDIGIYNGAALLFNIDLSQQQIDNFISRIKTDSFGALLIGRRIENADVMRFTNFDLSGLPGISLGTDAGNSREYQGLLTPAGDYRIGGGKNDVGNDGLGFHGLTDGVSPRKVIMEIPGSAILSQDNDFTGGIIVTNKAVLWFRNDTALGAVPASSVADYLYVDNASIRPEPNVPNASSDANRGLKVGDAGMTIYTPDNRYWAWQGNLSGSGPITVGGGGITMFGGAGNPWDGTLTLNHGNGTFAVGYGNNFSWNKSNIIQGEGYFGVATDQNITWSDKFENPLGTVPPQYNAPTGIAAPVGLRKMGAGTLTLDVPGTYRRDTMIESGTLKVGVADAIPYSWDKGLLHFYCVNLWPTTGTLDLNGHDVNVNGLQGSGTILDAKNEPSTLTIGNANGGGTFSGTVAAPAKLVKVGDGHQRFHKGTSLTQLDIQRGIVSVGAEGSYGDIALTGGANSTFNVGFSAGDLYGLTGEYYNFNFPELSHLVSTGVIVDLNVLENLLAPYVPWPVLSSASFGSGFDSGSNGERLQEGYNGREWYYGRWTGEFYAEAEGEYAFFTSSDDGSAVYIDRQPVALNDYMQGYDLGGGKRGGTVQLTQGWHDIIVAFYQGSGGKGLTVFMTPPGGAEAILPQSLLRPYPATVASLSGNSGARTEIFGNMALAVGNTTENIYAGRFISAATDARFIKDGPGDFLFAGQATPEYNGEVIIAQGALGLQAAEPFARPVEIAAGNTLFAMPDRLDWGNAGLKGSYYWGWTYGGATFADLENQFGWRTPDAVYNTTQTAPDALPVAESFWYYEGWNFPGPFAQGYPPQGEKRDFSTRFQGKFLALEAGDYTFWLHTDDRGDLYIDGQHVIEGANYNAAKTSAPVYLEAGTHDIQLAQGQGAGGYHIRLSVAAPGSTAFIPMPNAWLRPSVSTVYGVIGDGTLDMPYAGSYLCVKPAGSLTFAGSVTGVSGSEIEKNGVGAWTLTGNNDGFAGGWLLLKGTLIVGDGDTSGTLGGERIYVGAGAKLVFNRSDDIVYAGEISGSGEVCNIGSGRVIISNLGDDFKGVFASGVFVFTGENTAVQATSLVQDPDPSADPLTVHFEDGARLLIPPTDDPLTFPPLVFSNGTLELSVAGSGYYTIGSLMINAGTTVQTSMTMPSGLFGRYYAFSDTDPNGIASHFTSITAFENFVSGLDPLCKVSSWDAGESMRFGSSDNQGTDPLHLPQSIINRGSNFAAIWKGKIRITDPGTYSFQTWSDDNSMLYLDDALIVDNNNGHGMQNRNSAPMFLNAGLHNIAVLFAQGTGGYGLDVRILYPGQSVGQDNEGHDLAYPQCIPNSMLISDFDDIQDGAWKGLPVTPVPEVPFTVEVGILGVINGPGTGTLDVSGNGILPDGKLLLNDLYIESAGAVIATKGDTHVAASNLHVVMGHEPPKNTLTKIGDFSQSPSGLPLYGKTKSLEGADKGKLVYKPATASLYISTSRGTVMILR